MARESNINELITEDLMGYMQAGEDPSCTTEFFDLQGKKVEVDGG